MSAPRILISGEILPSLSSFSRTLGTYPSTLQLTSSCDRAGFRVQYDILGGGLAVVTWCRAVPSSTTLSSTLLRAEAPGQVSCEWAPGWLGGGLLPGVLAAPSLPSSILLQGHWGRNGAAVLAETQLSSSCFQGRSWSTK